MKYRPILRKPNPVLMKRRPVVSKPNAVLMKNQGAALIVVLMLVMVIGGISTLMFSRTINEIKNSASNASIVQTLMLARGSAAAGGAMLTGPISKNLNTILQNKYSRSDRWAFGGNGLGDSPNAQQVASDLSSKVAQDLQDQVDTQLCNSSLPTVDGGSVSLRIYFTNTTKVCNISKSLPTGITLSSGRFVAGSPRDGSDNSKTQTYALPFVMVSEATLGQYRRNVVLQGEYRFDLGVKSFARFALFTNHHATEDGTPIWFTDRTTFNGPIHTNQNFRFYSKPAFGGKVTSAGCIEPGLTSCKDGNYQRGAMFYDENSGGVIAPENMAPSSTAPAYTNTYGTHQPGLGGGVAWNEDFIALPTNADSQRTVAQSGGLYINDEMSKITLFAGDASTPGNPLTASGSSWTPNPAPYQYIETCDNKAVCTRYRYGSDLVLYKLSSSTWTKVKDNFNGMIFSDKAIYNLTGPSRTAAGIGDPDTAPPAIAAFAKLTVANAGSHNDIRIKGDLKYESVPCPENLVAGNTSPCSNLNAQNVLGVYSEEGDILIGDGTNNSLQDLTIQSVLMSGQGSVTVDNYTGITPRGSVNLLGGLIANYYGGFGQFNSKDGSYTHGYGRNFTYDQRMALGTTPPYFPGIGFKEGNTPVVISFGQRAQVY